MSCSLRGMTSGHLPWGYPSGCRGVSAELKDVGCIPVPTPRTQPTRSGPMSVAIFILPTPSHIITHMILLIILVIACILVRIGADPMILC